MPTLDAIFAASVAQHRDRLAIDVPAGRGRPAARMTYAELDARAAGVRAAIDRAVGAHATGGSADQQIVVVVLPRDGVDVYAAQLGIVRGGRAWCCLDPVHPDGHLASVIASVEPVLVITDHRHADRLRGVVGSIPVLDAQAIEATADAEPPCSSSDGLAYVISTSGTTGAPKGVMVRHASIAALVEADRARFGLGPSDRVAQCSSNAYDSSIEETWMALAVGATLVPVDDEVVRSGPDLPAWLRAQGITVFCPPPTLLRAMGVEEPARELPALRLVYVGGEPLPQDLSDLWSATLWLENGYGPTECTVTCTRGRMQPGVPVHLGDAVPGSHAIIVREDGTETIDGEEGELWMAGQCLADGYLRQPALTDERFVVDPRRGRVYRTGDLVRRSHGAIEYLGRIDAQVKVRGHRVELGAVEARLARAPGVREAACALVGEGSGARLAGIVVGEAIDVEAVLAHARRHLPPTMVPAYLLVAPSLPRMVSGKIDRRAVAGLLTTSSADTSTWDDQARDPSRSMAERVAACAAAAVGARELPSQTRHFFEDLGGDSLRAVDLVLRIRRSIGLEATVRMVYDEPTIAGLAKCVQGATAAARAEPHALAVVPMRSKLTAWIVQGLSLGLGAALAGTVGSWLAFRGVPAVVESVGVIGAAMMAPMAWGMARLAWFPASIACTLIAKRALIGRYEPGWVPAWSGRHVREWIVEQIGSTIPWSIAEGTALTAWGLRRLGARVGRHVHVHRGVNVLRGGWDLLEFGDGVTLCQDAAVLVSRIDRGGVEHGRVSIGDGATIGVRATVEPGVMIGAGAELAPLTT
ncbi:MAG: amino acid adenylation domain-containing protein, partial [Bacteroidia bacterium]|nr:amino acid adenylation domain-containing protein [Bacteroidia bacterium]